MSHFVGLDVSQKITAICVRTAENMASSVSLRSTIPRASADPETSASIWAWSLGGISRAGRLCGRRLQMRRSADADAALRGRQCHADALQGPAQGQARGLGLRDRQVIHDPKARIPLACRLGIMHALMRDAAVARKCRPFPEGVMNGSIPPTFGRSSQRDHSTGRGSVYDVRRHRGCTRCYAVHVGTFLWGFSTAPPKPSRPPCERRSPIPPISSERRVS